MHGMISLFVFAAGRVGGSNVGGIALPDACYSTLFCPRIPLILRKWGVLDLQKWCTYLVVGRARTGLEN